MFRHFRVLFLITLFASGGSCLDPPPTDDKIAEQLEGLYYKHLTDIYFWDEVVTSCEPVEVRFYYEKDLEGTRDPFKMVPNLHNSSLALQGPFREGEENSTDFTDYVFLQRRTSKSRFRDEMHDYVHEKCSERVRNQTYFREERFVEYIVIEVIFTGIIIWTAGQEYRLHYTNHTLNDVVDIEKDPIKTTELLQKEVKTLQFQNVVIYYKLKTDQIIASEKTRISPLFADDRRVSSEMIFGKGGMPKGPPDPKKYR